jgi:hypothetical protein
MKNIFLIIILILLNSCKTKKTIISSKVDKSIVIINIDKVDAKIKNRASEIGFRLLDACNSSKFKIFTSDEATERVIQNATSKKISETCKKINFRNGKFQGLNLIEIKQDQISKQYFFRYEIDYEKKYFKRELQVTLDSLNKVSKIITKELKRKPM